MKVSVFADVWGAQLPKNAGKLPALPNPKE